jgi:hypothetical protein
VDEFKRDIFQKVARPQVRNFNFSKTDKTNGDVTLHWMDGGIQPERPSELEPNEIFWRWWKWNFIYRN